MQNTDAVNTEGGIGTAADEAVKTTAENAALDGSSDPSGSVGSGKTAEFSVDEGAAILSGDSMPEAEPNIPAGPVCESGRIKTLEFAVAGLANLLLDAGIVGGKSRNTLISIRDHFAPAVMVGGADETKDEG